MIERNRTKRNENIIQADNLLKVLLNTGKYLEIDDFIWNKISDNTLYANKCDEYTDIMVHEKLYYLHRYIYYNVYHRVKRPGYKVDHDNRNPLDVTIKNLREVTDSVNARNRTKAKNCTSIYKGVVYDRFKHKWVCRLSTKGKNYQFFYTTEQDAAYHYNLLLISTGLIECTPRNDIEKPIDFVLATNRTKSEDLPLGISKYYNKYRYNLRGKMSRGFNTADEAVLARNINIEQDEMERISKIIIQPILRNCDGIPIVEYFNKEGEKIGEITIDAHRYYELKLNTSYINGEYIDIRINNKHFILSRYLLNCTDETKYVDHKDGNKFNYQMNNLRIITPLQNSQNRCSLINSSSQYVGVAQTPNNKWRSYIEHTHIGIYTTEYEAAISRDIKAYELNLLGNLYRINLLEDLQINLFIKSTQEEHFKFNYLFF